MGTQGIVSIVDQHNQTVMKFVAGDNGMKAPVLAAWLRENYQERHTYSDLYAKAIELGFGCEDCLVLIGQCAMFSHIPGDSPPSYRETFDKPEWNPRWERGSADYVEMVRVPDMRMTKEHGT